MAYLGVLAALVIGGIALLVWYKLYQKFVESAAWIRRPRENRVAATTSRWKLSSPPTAVVQSHPMVASQLRKSRRRRRMPPR